MFRLVLSILVLFLSFFTIACTSSIPANSIYDVSLAPYNAFGDGSTDDTAAIQCAIEDAKKNGGGTVYLPIGIYAHSGLSISGNSVRLKGAVETGAQINGTSLLYTPSSGTQLFIGGNHTVSVHVENLTFLTEQNQTSGEFIKVKGYYNNANDQVNIQKIRFTNLQIHGWEGHPIYYSGHNGILIDGVNSITLDHVKLDGLNGDYAIKLAGTEKRTDIVRLSNITYNSYIEGGSDSTDGLVIEDNVNSVKTFAVDMLQAYRGYVIGSQNPNLPDADWIFLLDVTAENSRREGILSLNHRGYLEIKNCYVHVNGLHGINVFKDSGPTHISGCTIQRNGESIDLGGDFASGIWLAGKQGGSVIGNYIADNSYAGINIIPSADGFSITSNNLVSTIFDSQGSSEQDYGVIFNSGSKNNAFSSNILNKNSNNTYVGGSIVNTVINDNVVVN